MRIPIDASQINKRKRVISMNIKSSIETAVAKGDIEAAIKTLLALDLPDSNLKKEIISLSSRYNRYKDAYHSGTGDNQEEFNKITQSVLYYSGKFEGIVEGKDRIHSLEASNQSISKVASNRNNLMRVFAVLSAILLLSSIVLTSYITNSKNQIDQLKQEVLTLRKELEIAPPNACLDAIDRMVRLSKAPSQDLESIRVLIVNSTMPCRDGSSK